MMTKNSEGVNSVQASPHGERRAKLIQGLQAGISHADRWRAAAADAQLEKMLTGLLKTKSTFELTGSEQCAGRLAEVWHAGTFNASAAQIGSRLKAVTTASLGAPCDAADVLVRLGQKTVGKAQLKFCGSITDTTRSIADCKYDGMQRVVASDQVDGVRALAARRGVDGLGNRNYPATASETSATIRAGRVSSRPLSSGDAQRLGRDPKAFVNRQRAAVAAGAVGNAALSAALIGVATSAFSDARAVRNGEKSLAQAARAAGTAGLRSGTSAAVGTAVTLLARRACGANPAAAIGGFAADLAIGAVELQRGQISRAELLERSATSAARAAGTAAGAALGTALMPVIGTAIGGALGGSAAEALLGAARRGLRQRRSLRPTIAPAVIALPMPPRLEPLLSA